MEWYTLREAGVGEGPSEVCVQWRIHILATAVTQPEVLLRMRHRDEKPGEA